MTTKAIAAIGTLVKLGDGEPSEEFTTLAEVGDIDGPSFTAEDIDVTNHSTEGSFDESIPGLLSAGQLSFPMNKIASDLTQLSLRARYLARDRFNVQIITPPDVDDTSEADRTVQAVAYVKQLGMKAPVKGALRDDVILKLVGAPQFGLGS